MIVRRDDLETVNHIFRSRRSSIRLPCFTSLPPRYQHTAGGGGPAVQKNESCLARGPKVVSTRATTVRIFLRLAHRKFARNRNAGRRLRQIVFRDNAPHILAIFIRRGRFFFFEMGAGFLTSLWFFSFSYWEMTLRASSCTIPGRWPILAGGI